MTDKVIVDLGGEGHYQNGTVTVNINPESGSDIICDITARGQELHRYFPYGSVDMFTCIHTLEHLDPADVPESLLYWKSILKDGGRLLVIVPDLKQLWQDVMNEIVSEDVAIAITFRNNFNGKFEYWDTHKWGWTRKTLRRDMASCGFKVIDPERPFSKDYIFDDYSFSYTGDVHHYVIPNLRVMGLNK